ncbi:Major Facilitator Superfamily transporter [Streptomyces noursei ATCC 11455]|uniref:MFS transporter n=1 Tax=Streptomyces noursei TaxID=1971 RepID=UPI00081C4036|nr:Major Facilitator Superfamily transporter [Streptomyces noursei ATCC 11455]
MAPAQQAAPRARQPGQPDRMPFVLVTAGFWSAFDRFAMTTVLVAIADGFHTKLSAAVAVASAYFLAYGCLQPVWGVLSDRFGRSCAGS